MKVIFLLFALMPIMFISADEVIINCKVTPEIYHVDNIPKNFSSFNNLRRKPGSPIVAEGRLINISGKLVDKNCVPIQNAKVSIWHMNAYGDYQYDDSDHRIAHIDPNFSGSGSIVTNNMGEFSFITILPGEFTNKIPFIDFKIEHEDFLPFETRMFFSDKSPELKKFNKEIAKRLVAVAMPDNRYEFNITLSGSNIYRRY